MDNVSYTTKLFLSQGMIIYPIFRKILSSSIVFFLRFAKRTVIQVSSNMASFLPSKESKISNSMISFGCKLRTDVI